MTYPVFENSSFDRSVMLKGGGGLLLGRLGVIEKGGDRQSGRERGKFCRSKANGFVSEWGASGRQKGFWRMVLQGKGHAVVFDGKARGGEGGRGRGVLSHKKKGSFCIKEGDNVTLQGGGIAAAGKKEILYHRKV